MTKYRWRNKPDVLATMVDTGSIKSWVAKDVILKPNEAVTIIANGKVQDTLSETYLRNFTGGWTRWLGGKLGLGASDHKLLFTMTGPFDLLFRIKGQLADGATVEGIADLRLQFNREDTPKLLNVFANGPRVIDRGYVVKMYQQELIDRVLRPLLSQFNDGISIRSPEFQEAFEMACRTEMRASLGMAGITLLKAYVTVNETDVEKLASYRNEMEMAQASDQVDSDAKLAEIERARETTLARIGLEADVAKAKARGQVEAALEIELKELRKREAALSVKAGHERQMSEIRTDEKDKQMQIAMTAFEQVQAKKQERMRLEAELNQSRQSQTDSIQKEVLEMASNQGAMSPEVVMQFLREQTKQKQADK
jgi:hypothetical protein